MQDPSVGVQVPPLLDPEIERRISRISLGANASPELWAALPELCLRIRGGEASRRTGPVESTRARLRAFHRTAGPQITQVGSLLVIDVSIQTRRVTGPVVDELAERRGGQSPFHFPRLDRSQYSDARAATNAALEEFLKVTGDAGLPVVTSAESELLKASILRKRAGLALQRSDSLDSILVATQHSTPTRAVLSAAHDFGDLVTFYMPHAPVTTNRFYRDLPVHLALLRGPAEVAYYRDLGASDDARVVAFGHTAPEVPAQGPGRDAAHFVLALSPHPEWVLRKDVDVVSKALPGEQVLVALHPRMSAGAVRPLMPPHWRILTEQGTASFIRTHGARAVIQHGSGTGLEALSMGLEVIDLCADAESPNYPYLSAPLVQLVGSSSELQVAISRLESRRAGLEGRLAAARSWAGRGSLGSTADLVDFLDETRRLPVPDSLLLDGWRDGSERSKPSRM